MKKIVATRFALIIGTVMVIISLLNVLIQKDDSMNHMKNNSSIMIKQIDVALKKNEQEIVKKTEVRNLISRMPVSDGMTYYVVEKTEHRIVGATDNSLVTTVIEELMGEWKLGEVVTSSASGVKKCFYFEEVGDYYIGVSQLESVVLENMKSNVGQLFIYLFIAAYIMILGSMSMVDRYIIRDIDKINTGMKDITDGKLDTVIKVDNTPELESLSVNINQMTASLMEQNRKLSKVLNAVDMLIAVYEYGTESNKVLVSGKLGAILMMSEEEMKALLEDKHLFEQKILSIKQQPVEGFRKVYQLPVETECYVKIESLHNQQSEFGVIMDVTEEIIDKQRLQRERDYDLLTGLLSRRAFYQKMKVLYENPKQLENAVLMMCDLDGLKQFNDTYGHANGDKAIKKAAEILYTVKDDKCYISRLSGDEYAMVIYGAESDEVLKEKIKKVYDVMTQAKIEVFGKSVDVRLSGGYVFYSKYPDTLDQLLKKADQALYESKENGRARFTEYQ